MIAISKFHRVLTASMLFFSIISVVGCDYLQTEGPPEIVAFTVNPTEIEVGEKATLLWNVTGALAVVIEPEVGAAAVAGVQEVAPVTTTTYTITASNLQESVEQSVTLTVLVIEEKPPEEVPTPAEPELTAEHYYDQGVYLAEKGRYEQAIIQFNKAIDLEPDYREAYYARGLAYYDKGDCRGAIADYTKAVELNSDLVRVYLDRGIAYKRCGDEAHALADFKKCLELSNDNYLSEEARAEIQKLKKQQ